MTRKQRWFAYELVAFAMVAFFGLVAVPGLISARDSVAVLAGCMLLLAFFGWGSSLVYRFNKFGGFQ